MINKLFKKNVIENVGSVALIILLMSCLVLTCLEENVPSWKYNSSSESLGSYKNYCSTNEVAKFPDGCIVEANENGLKVILSNGNVAYETKKEVKYCNREGYIYEVDEYGRYSIINLKTGEVEKPFSKNEIVVGYIAGFWIIKVEVISYAGIVSDFYSYYYLLDENYQFGANGFIFDEIHYDEKDNYIYGTRELNYTMYNRDGVEKRDRNSAVAIILDGEIVYTTNENSNVRYVEDGIAKIYFYNDELEAVYVSLRAPNKGQIIKVN